MDHGPVMVYLEFRIEPSQAAEFDQAMRALEPIRRRDGAVMWSFFSDIADRRRYVEAYMVETWGEHVRQHYRGTASDSEAWQRVRAFHVGPQPPIVSHLIAPAPRGRMTAEFVKTAETGRWPTFGATKSGTGS